LNKGFGKMNLNAVSGWLGIGFGRPGYHYSNHAPACGSGCCGETAYDHHAAQLDLHSGNGAYRGCAVGCDASSNGHALPTVDPPAHGNPQLAPQPVPAPVNHGARRPRFNLNRGY